MPNLHRALRHLQQQRNDLSNQLERIDRAISVVSGISSNGRGRGSNRHIGSSSQAYCCGTTCALGEVGRMTDISKVRP